MLSICKTIVGVQGYGRVAPSSGGQQGSAGIPPSQGYGNQSQGGQSYGGQSQGGGQSGGSNTDSKYNASYALADQGIADQAAYVGSKTVGHHNIPHYEEEDPKLPTAGDMSKSGGGQGGGNSRGDNLPSQDQVTAATEGHPTGQV